MILDKDFRQANVEIVGDVDDRIEMGVDSESINHLMMILSSNLYQNSIGSIVREYTSNAIDANVEANIDEPVIVSLKKNTTGNWYFEVQDFGPGLDDVDFRNIISKYGKSTKKDKDNQLGYYGLGCKSGFSYSDSFYYTCRKDSIERKYLLYKSDSGFTIDLMFEQPTSERNGVAVTIPVKYSDYENFRKEIRNQLAYFDNVYFDVQLNGYSYDNTKDLNEDFKIYTEKDFHYSTFTKIKEMHLTLGKVNYPINWDALGITRLEIPIALKFDLDSGLFPIPNRENLIWNQKTKDLVLAKIKDVANWFVDRYNETLTKHKTLLEAWEFIGNPKNIVTLYDKAFIINELEHFSTKVVKEIEIEGLTLLKPSWYKRKYPHLIEDYRIVAEMSFGILKTKRIGYYVAGLLSDKTRNALLHEDTVISGHFRDYLKTKSYRYFLKPTIDIKNYDDLYYEQLLGTLKTDPLFKDKIKEYNKVKKQLIEELFVDCTTLQDSKEYLDFKKLMKSKPKNKVSLGLNKQKHEVTIAYVTRNYSKYSFKKATYTLEDLYKNPYLSVILTDEEAKLVDYYSFSKSKVKFCKIGVQDHKKVEKLKLHNFMSYKDFQRTKSFSRTVTGLLAGKVIKSYERILSYHMDIVHDSLSKVHTLYVKVKKYKDALLPDHPDFTSVPIADLFAIANKYDLWDKEYISDIRELETYISDFEFITLLEQPRAWDTTKKDVLQKHIYEILLFKKNKYPEKLTNLTIKTLDNGMV